MDKATRAVDEILAKLKNDVGRITLVPSSGGVFQVRYDRQTIFNIEESGRFPNPGELLDIVEKKTGH